MSPSARCIGLRDVAIEFVGADIIRPRAATWGGPYLTPQKKTGALSIGQRPGGSAVYGMNILSNTMIRKIDRLFST